jgi:flagellar FliL protein
MAEAAKKLKEVPKKLEAVPAAGAPEKKKFDVLGLVSVLIISLNLAAVVGLGMYMKKIWAKMMEVETKMEEVMQAQKEEEAPPAKEKLAGRAITPPVPATLYPLESFLVNITSDQGPKFLQTQMELELTDSATEEEITKKKAAIRDAVIVLLSSRSYKQIRETSGMVTLRRDILRAVNNLLTSGQVREVYFTQFHFN